MMAPHKKQLECSVVAVNRSISSTPAQDRRNRQNDAPTASLSDWRFAAREAGRWPGQQTADQRAAPKWSAPARESHKHQRPKYRVAARRTSHGLVDLHRRFTQRKCHEFWRCNSPRTGRCSGRSHPASCIFRTPPDISRAEFSIPAGELYGNLPDHVEALILVLGNST